jgi:hypothetical protein
MSVVLAELARALFFRLQNIVIITIQLNARVESFSETLYLRSILLYIV